MENNMLNYRLWRIWNINQRIPWRRQCNNVDVNSIMVASTQNGWIYRRFKRTRFHILERNSKSISLGDFFEKRFLFRSPTRKAMQCTKVCLGRYECKLFYHRSHHADGNSLGFPDIHKLNVKFRPFGVTQDFPTIPEAINAWFNNASSILLYPIIFLVAFIWKDNNMFKENRDPDNKSSSPAKAFSSDINFW